MKKNYKLRTRIALVAAGLTMAFSFNANAQVDVLATGGIPAGTYTTLNAAFAAINAGTHTGNIAIGISANTTETGPCVLNGSGAGAASYIAIGISPTIDGVSVSGPTTAGRGLIELNGADNVTIDGDNPNTGGFNRDLTIQNTAANTVTYTSVIRLAIAATVVNSADNITIRNTTIIGSATGRNIPTATSTTGTENTTFGILAGGGGSTVSNTTAPSAITSVNTTVGTGGTFASLNISSNQIDACARGIAVQGSAITVAPALSITFNSIGSLTPGNSTTVYARGMTVQGFNNALIASNLIQNMGWYAGTSEQGIGLGDVSAFGTNAIVEKNIIRNITNLNTGTFGAYGINVACGPANIVQNNMISGLTGDMSGGGAFSTTFGIVGIRLATSTGHKVYNNSVNLFGLRPGTANTSLLSASFAITGTAVTGCDIRNNIFSNTMTGGTTSIAYVNVFLPTAATSAMNLTINNNAYFSGTDAARQGLAQAGTTAGTNFYLASNFNPAVVTPAANWRSYTSTLNVAGTNDNASFASTNAAPFISATDLHLDVSSSEIVNVEQKGDASVPLTVDIDNQVRPNAATTIPDMGADEIALVNCSAANGGTISPSAVNKCNGQTATLSSTGTSTGIGTTYQWQMSNTAGGPYSNVVGGTGANTTTYTTPALTTGVYYFVLETTCSFGPLTGLSNEVTVTVTANPIVSVTPSSATLCSNAAPVALTASGATTYLWLPSSGLTPSTGATVSASPSVTTTYTVTGADGNGCTASASTVISVLEAPGVIATATPSAICIGSNAQLLATGGLTTNYMVQPSAYALSTPSGTPTTIFTTGDDIVSGSIALPFSFNYFGQGYTNIFAYSNGYVQFASSGAANLYGAIIPAAAAPNNIIAGVWDDLNVTGAGSIVSYFTNGTAPNRVFVVDYTNVKFYNAAANNGNASFQIKLYESGLIEVHVGAATDPTPSNHYLGIENSTGTNGYFPAGRNPFTANISTPEAWAFVPSGGTVTYSWSPATFLSSNSIANPIAQVVTASTTYTVTATEVNGCSSTASVTVTVNPLPTVTAMSSDTDNTICNGTSVTLNGGGASTYTWAGATAVTNNVAFTPSATDTYTVTGTDVNGCINTATVTVTVNPLPSVMAMSSDADNTICAGSSITLSGMGAVSYSWIGGVTDATPFNPTSTNTYTVTGTDASGCMNTATVTVTVNPLPSVMAMSSDADNSICTGSSITLSGMGAVSYSWTGGVTDATPFTPTSTNTYTVTGTDANGCTNTATATVTVNSLPSIMAMSNDADNTICAGSSITLSGMGAVSYSWTGGVTDATPFNPTSTNTYTVTGTDANGCTNTATATVTVNSLPSIIAMSNDADNTICAGSSITLSGMGAVSYSWTGGVTDATPFNPTSTNTYTVTGTDANGCMNTATGTVTVNSLPSIIAMSNDADNTICAGSSITLSGMGAVSYSWTGGVTDATPFNPTSTNTYTVTGTDANGCMNTNTITVTVNSLPSVTAMSDDADNTICAGSMITLSGMGAATYTWTGAVTDATPFTPAATDTYTVTGTDANGCMNTNTITITVNSSPTVTAMSDDADNTICAGSMITLSGMGAATYTWTGAVTDATPFTPAATDTYTVTGTDANGCMNTNTITVTVNNLPAVTMSAFSTSVCDNGGPVSLGGGSPAGGIYSGTGVSGTTFDPTGLSGMYLITYTVTDVNSCSNSDTASIMVDLCSGIASNTESTGVNIYPNPANGMVNVSIAKANSEQITINIVDMQGKQVYNETNKNIATEFNTQINIESLAKGVYYIKITTDNNTEIQKLIVH